MDHLKAPFSLRCGEIVICSKLLPLQLQYFSGIHTSRSFELFTQTDLQLLGIDSNLGEEGDFASAIRQYKPSEWNVSMVESSRSTTS